MKKDLVNLALGISILAILISGFAVSQKGEFTAEQFDKLAEGYAQRMQEKEEKKNNKNAVNIAPINEQDHVKGNRDAEVTIFEYSDFECPFCKRFYKTPGEVVAKFDGKVNAVFRNFPLPSHNPLATTEANAAECAAEQGGDKTFFAYNSQIFERTKSNNGLDPKELYAIASDLKLDQNKFKECLDNEKYAEKVQNDIQSGIAAGVTGTPGVIIKNNKTGEIRVMPGAVPLEMVENAVNELLKK